MNFFIPFTNNTNLPDLKTHAFLLTLFFLSEHPRNKDSTGWQLAFTSPYIDQLIERVALNAKLSPASQGGEAGHKMLAISYASHIRLWAITEEGTRNDIGL